ncbi:AraC-type DNA-binding protein [Pedobacter westerhofensis]|uniref:AraC-type DNA-binding protein n=1 Tax=Pedobacter westerhofensis TaxID=425512 RepID=A0A521CUM4_9SPHI|nr:helix-turn-helix domain-containing protein [Pedobacter westerhofensis]SMO62421.1 AraC-type DNA-binding protein [Pedobacter westerhofensis]
MYKKETIEAFYKNNYHQTPGEEEMNFNVLNYKKCLEGDVIPYRRRDYYKVTFLTGHYLLHYGDKSLEIKGTLLAFFSPEIPYTADAMQVDNKGAYFIFREAYFNEFYKGNIRDLPIFASKTIPIYQLDEPGASFVEKMLDKMTDEMNSDYEFKHDLIRSYILELLHFALKMQPTENLYKNIDAKTRITNVFNELLDRQFPIESPDRPLNLRSAGDYAEKLGIHVNYLNRALRTATGITTTEHINERIIREAIKLLKHSDWNIAEICYSLGFEDPSHFNHFFKRQTNLRPSHYRMQFRNIK